MAIEFFRYGLDRAVKFALGAVIACAFSSNAQAPLKTNLRKILVLDKNQGGANGHMESRRDLNAALKELAAEKGFAITFISQNDPASKISLEFSEANLASHQAVIFSSNDGVDAQLDSASKNHFENYLKAGGGFVPIHAASAFISDWPWLTWVLVESLYLPCGSGDRPPFNIIHDAEGEKEGTETNGIFKGLTAPVAFVDECYSFRASPRGRPGVSILLTVDEKSFRKPLDAPMGDDHPVAWSKTEGKGRVVHISQGHSHATLNVYWAKNAYLKNLVYGALRYVAGDFLGCADNAYKEYSPDATKNDPAACLTPVGTVIRRPDGKLARSLITREEGLPFVHVELMGAGKHSVTLLDVAGRVLHRKLGMGPAAYTLPLPSQSGIYTVEGKSGGDVIRLRTTVL